MEDLDLWPARSRQSDFLWRNLSFQDRACLAYQLFMALRVLAAPEPKPAAIAWTALLTGLTVATIALVRFDGVCRGLLRSVAYRVGIFAAMVLSYLSLQSVLPALQPQLLDETLLSIDRALLGETPAVLLAPLASNTAVVEWFAFFYFSYYILLAVGFLPALWGDRGSRAMRELFVGAAVISCVGYATYTLVPGVGPYAAISFQTPLAGGAWWQAVCSTVAVGGAKLDIFPSLHTAFPVFLVLHAFAHRRRPGASRYGWLLWGFFAVNIVVSTMFLRWHYAIDVVAGLTLAVLARRVAVYVASNERARDRIVSGLQPVWP